MQFRGRHGRLFLRALTERLHSRGQHHSLTPALRFALHAWARPLSCARRPRSLNGHFTQTSADIVMFTDEAARDTRKRDDTSAPSPRVGEVFFERQTCTTDERALFSNYRVPGSTTEKWVGRKPHFAVTELLGAVLCLAVGRTWRLGSSAFSPSVTRAIWHGRLPRRLTPSCMSTASPTDANPADGLSCGRTTDLENCGGVWVYSDPPLALLFRTEWRKQLVSWATSNTNATDTQKWCPHDDVKTNLPDTVVDLGEAVS